MMVIILPPNLFTTPRLLILYEPQAIIFDDRGFIIFTFNHRNCGRRIDYDGAVESWDHTDAPF
ncbi:hypothetical protein NCCP2378_13970 [Sporosarcina sp. NCCP-2378]|nr:hypothetical protein NCCP2378_13970 [Sporosarcina sp. NCCP-2378]